MFKSFALGLASMALAAQAIPMNKEFHIAFTYNDKNHTAGAVCNGTDLYVLGIAELAGVPPTPAYFTGPSDNATLNLAIDGKRYGVSIPEVGDYYGHAYSVYAREGKGEYGWEHGNGGIGHSLQAALNEFYACEAPANGKAGIFLRWGTPFTNFSSPPGCVETSIYQVDNVPGGLKPSS